MKRALTLLLMLAGLTISIVTVWADLRAPTWYDPGTVGTTPDWHYRVPISIPSGTATSGTIKVDVDFAALLTTLGVSGTFDSNSPRVVRSTGVLSTYQQYTDAVYGSATDSTGNSRGEIRFINEDAGAVTYYLYFDITENGAKTANPQTPINGNFEFGGTGTTTPSGWSVSTTTGFDAEIRPSESPSITTDGTTVGNGTPPKTTDGTPNTGAYSYLLGARSANESSTTTNAVTLSKTITVPSSSPGNLSIRYRPEGWDSSANSATQYDFIRVSLVGTATTEIVGPTAGSYTTYPFSPNLGTTMATSSSTGMGMGTTGVSGYGQYNGWDTDADGVHRSSMTIARGSEPWFTRTVSLTAYAGQTITLSITTSHVVRYRAWFHIDDVEWSVVSGTLGTPEAFGVNITAPLASTSYSAGQVLVIRAQVDALPTASANPVTANVYDNSGTLVASGIVLYNDGTHGDTTADDALWSNDGSVAASTTYTFPSTATAGTSWSVRVFAKDASTSSLSASNGLVHISGQATSETQSNFWNIDEQTFTVTAIPVLAVSKVSTVIWDPVNLYSNPKRIPGSIVEYTITVTNSGPGTVDASTLVMTDVVPANTSLCVGAIAQCTVIQFADGTPVSGLSYSSSNSTYSSTTGGGAPFTYAPTANAATGVDTAVTGIRVAPTGTMSAVVTSGSNPSFTISFRVKVN